MSQESDQDRTNRQWIPDTSSRDRDIAFIIFGVMTLFSLSVIVALLIR